MREAGPDLLSLDHPFVALPPRAGADIGEIRAGTGLRIALAPDFLAACDRGQEARLLLVGAEGEDRRAGEFDADMVEPGRGARARIFLGEDDLLGERGIAAAIGLGPADAAPARFAQPALPVAAAFGHFGQAGEPAHVGEGAFQFGLEPRGCLSAESLFLGRKSKLHAASSNPASPATCSRCQSGVPSRLALLRARLK
ncbi:hypothetical protein ATE75_04335 [Sphingopyxis sp. H080]|nr:hypothetical protein ATE75_04335 [Sphingopyxis sp. H080]